jgi:EAL domain-containing protein (putative c-di-GMP-specific phosphodiesterase class I)
LERQELALLYQPVLDRSCRAIIGFEALLRWTCGDRGTLVAEQFVPIARESRLIIPIGIWALRLACEDAADWPDGIGVSLNVAGEQLADAGLVTSVMQALSQARLHPHRLTIDVGEEALRIAGSAGLLVLDQLQALGVRLSLGEFGTGASALGHLSQSRFAGVKVHPRLIRDAAQGSRESAARIRAITTLADSLGLSATVVGIETEAQMRMACDLGASQLQGFLLGVPGPVQSVPALLASPPTPRAVA